MHYKTVSYVFVFYFPRTTCQLRSQCLCFIKLKSESTTQHKHFLPSVSFSSCSASSSSLYLCCKLTNTVLSLSVHQKKQWMMILQDSVFVQQNKSLSTFTSNTSCSAMIPVSTSSLSLIFAMWNLGMYQVTNSTPLCPFSSSSLYFTVVCLILSLFSKLVILASSSAIRFGDPDWFFFSPVDFKYLKSKRFNRTTKCGFWKATGKDRDIRTGDTDNTVIGTKKTLVYYQGRVSCGVKSNWVIHEYHAVTFHENQVRFFYSINFNTA